MSIKQTLFLIVLGLASAVAGFMLYQANKSDTQEATESQAQKPAANTTRRPDFKLADVDGVEHSISEWDGKVIILNFWATWCPPCRREMPAFIKLQEQYGEQGLQIIGLAIDQVDLVEAFADNVGVNYPILVGENDAIKITEDYGNRYGQLPYTVFIDRQGNIRHIKHGEVTYDQAVTFITPLLKP